MTEAKRLLELALYASPEEAFLETGLSRTRLLHRALLAAHDPKVALQHPELVHAVEVKLAAKRRRRGPAHDIGVSGRATRG